MNFRYFIVLILIVATFFIVKIGLRTFINKDLNKIHSKISKLNKKIRQVNEAQEEIPEQKQESLKLELNLKDKTEKLCLSSLYKQIDKLVNDFEQNKIFLEKIEPNKDKEKKKNKIYSIKIETHSNFENFTKFLSDVDCSERLIDIENCTITRLENNNLNINLLINLKTGI